MSPYEWLQQKLQDHGASRDQSLLITVWAMDQVNRTRTTSPSRRRRFLKEIHRAYADGRLIILQTVSIDTDPMLYFRCSKLKL
jgi:hypothetical protein